MRVVIRILGVLVAVVLVAIVGLGIAWASIMGVPYIMAVRMVPSSRYGVYMGVINMMIVIPMLINVATVPLYYDSLMGGDARNILMLAGVLMVCAALAVLRARDSDLGMVKGPTAVSH